MKKNIIFFILFCFNSFVLVRAQTGGKRLNKIYIQSGIGAGSKAGSNDEIGFQAILDKKWSATLSCQGFTMKPKNMPADYQAEWGTIFFIPWTHNIEVNMKIFSLTAGRYFHLGRNSWATTEAGLSFVKGEKASFQPTPIETYDFLFATQTTSNYSTTLEKKTTLGGMLRADINWAFSSFMGLGAGVFANFNSIQSPMGFQLKLTLGFMGRQKKRN